MQHYAVVMSIRAEGDKAGLVGMAAFGMGRCSLRAGQMEQAKQFFDRAVELIPALEPQVARLLRTAA
jgi:hypothetical protein